MAKKERKLTPAEEERKAAFLALCGEMAQRGYAKADLTLGVVAGNILALLIMLPFAVGAVLLFIVIAPEGTAYRSPTLAQELLFLLSLVLLIVLHELIHGLTWGIFAKGHLKSIRFGFIAKMLTPYCTCAQPLTRGQYLVGCAMPTLLLGFAPAVIAGLTGNFLLLALSVILLFGGGGDFCIIAKILLFHPAQKTVLFYDHPYELGVVAFIK